MTKSTLERKKPVRDPYLALASTVAKHRKRVNDLMGMSDRTEIKLGDLKTELKSERQLLQAAVNELTLGPDEELEETEELEDAEA